MTQAVSWKYHGNVLKVGFWESVFLAVGTLNKS